MTAPADPGTIPDLSRVNYFDGQRLAALDLNDASLVQRELRWLHNRSLHNWGIGLGFAVSGAKGATQVTIGSGYAVDCLGRELILTETITRPVPARANDGNGRPATYYLVAAYPDDASIAVLEQRLGECDTSGAVRLQERAAIYWRAAGEQPIETGIEIVLAQAAVFNCQLASPLSLDQRRTARPSQQPRIGAGSSGLGKTVWESWQIVSDSSVDGTGVRASIDTSAARFGIPPVYQAQMRGLRVMEQDGRSIILDGTALVSDFTRQSFTFAVLMQPALTAGGQVPVNPADVRAEMVAFANQNWWVEWIGVEG